MSLLKDKSTLITGATRGIGRGIAIEFAKQGAKVAFTYLSSAQKANELENELKSFGVEAKGYQVDAGDLSATEALIGDIVANWGSIDVIVNNAGITQDNLILRMTEEQFENVIKTNLNSVFNTTKVALKTMLRQRSGAFINISSVVGISGNAGQSNYAASKAGIIGFTKSIAQEVASRNIRANVVAPGFIATEMTDAIPAEELKKWLENIPLKRAGTPEDVARACVFLASDMSSYVTGQVIQVDGGMR